MGAEDTREITKQQPSDGPSSATDVNTSARDSLQDEYLNSRCANYGPFTIPSGIAVGILTANPWLGIATSVVVGGLTCGKEVKEVYDAVKQK